MKNFVFALLAASSPAFASTTPSPEATVAFLMAEADLSDITVESLATLTSLMFHRRCLGDDALAHLVNVPALKDLAWHNDGCDEDHRVHGPGLRWVATLKELEHLDLDHNSVEADELAHLAPLTKLRSLKLMSNHLAGQDLSALGALPALETLMLSDNGITDETAYVTFASLASLPRLKTLAVGDNDFGDAGLAALSGLSIETLSLGTSFFPARATQIRLTPQGARSLMKLPRLRHLNVHGAIVADGAYEALFDLPLESLTTWQVLDQPQISLDQYIALIEHGRIAGIPLLPTLLESDASRVEAALRARTSLQLIISSELESSLVSYWLAAERQLSVQKVTLSGFIMDSQDATLQAILALPALQELVVEHPGTLHFIGDAARTQRPDIVIR